VYHGVEECYDREGGALRGVKKDMERRGLSQWIKRRRGTSARHKERHIVEKGVTMDWEVKRRWWSMMN
jgi:hypothetical protein